MIDLKVYQNFFRPSVLYKQTWICFFWCFFYGLYYPSKITPQKFHHHQKGEFLLVHFLHPHQRVANLRGHQFSLEGEFVEG